MSAYLATRDIMIDTIGYTWSFIYRYRLPNYNGFENIINSNTEIGYVLLNKFIYIFTDTPFIFFFILALFVSYSNLLIARKIINRIFVRGSLMFIIFVIIYISSLYFFFSTYLIKQIIAITLGNIGMYMLFNNKKYAFWTFSLLAYSFHASAIVLIMIFLGFKFIKSYKTLISVLMLTILSILSFEIVFTNIIKVLPFINAYIELSSISINASTSSFAVTLKGLPYYIISFFALLNRNKIIKLTHHADFLIYSSLVQSISWILSIYVYWFFRVGLFFAIPTMILALLTTIIIKDKYMKVVYLILIIGLFSLITYRQIYLIF